jgi:hypothetical protein
MFLAIITTFHIAENGTNFEKKFEKVSPNLNFKIYVKKMFWKVKSDFLDYLQHSRCYNNQIFYHIIKNRVPKQG